MTEFEKNMNMHYDALRGTEFTDEMKDKLQNLYSLIAIHRSETIIIQNLDEIEFKILGKLKALNLVDTSGSIIGRECFKISQMGKSRFDKLSRDCSILYRALRPGYDVEETNKLLQNAKMTKESWTIINLCLQRNIFKTNSISKVIQCNTIEELLDLTTG